MPPSPFTRYVKSLWAPGRAPYVVALALLALIALPAPARAEIPPPPGGPVLVITDPADPFSRYHAEILRAEGLMLFDVVDLADVTPEALAAHDVALLDARPLDENLRQMFSDWVSNGGGLIVMRPDDGLAGLIGMRRASGSISDRYIHLIANTGPGIGIVAEPMQYHGAADLWTADGATTIAALEASPGAPSPYVAVSLRPVGAHGGQVAAFAYDLARSVVYTRQGNPDWTGQERDGLPPRRSDDLFFGAAENDPQRDWLDHDRVAIPQADEQQRLLANLITTMASHRVPLPRFWYFPGTTRAVVMMTGDDHAHGGTLGRFDLERAASPPGCSAPDWECVRSTSYVYPGTPISDSAAVAATADGFEIGLHLNTHCQDFPSAAWLDSTLAAQLAALAVQLPSQPAPSTNRTHCIAWSDWSTEAHVEWAHGIRLDCTYYYWPNRFAANTPGYFTGSGIPMRFADLDGSLVDVYQAPTQLPDESQLDIPWHIGALIDRALDPSGYYGVIVANMHTDSVVHNEWASIVAAARMHDVPVVSGRQLLTWLDARGRSAFHGIVAHDDTLVFDVAADSAARHLSVLVPLVSGQDLLGAVTLDDAPVAFASTVIKGVSYARFECAGGHVVAIYQPDRTAPVIDGAVAVPDDAGGASVIWETDRPATSRVDFGLSPGVLVSHLANPSRVLHHSLRLDHLLPDTTYWLRVSSTDDRGNTGTHPESPDPPLHFSTAPMACGHDASALDFAPGLPDSGAWVSHRVGAVTLRPADAAEFDEPDLPAGWSGAATTIDGFIHSGPGGLVLDGATVGAMHGVEVGDALETRARLASPGASLAADSEDGAQRAGFAVLGDGSLAAITAFDGGQDTTQLGPADTLVHRYRIARDTALVSYSMDGVVVASHGRVLDATLRFVASDSVAGGDSLVIERVIATPYAAIGSFISRVFDANALTPWLSALWDVDLPAETQMIVSVRGGNSPVPGLDWSPFHPLAGVGSATGLLCRFAQYRVDLATGDPGVTPTLQTVVLSCPAAVASTTAVPVSPLVTTLSGAIPNPTHDAAMFSLSLARSGPVELAVFAVDGRRVRTLARGWRPAGTTRIGWDGRDDSGRESGSGVYWVRLSADGVRQTRRVVRMR